MENTIHLKIKKPDLKIELQIPNDKELLNEILDKFTQFNDEGMMMREEETSKSLQKYQELKKVYDEYQKTYGRNHFQYTNIPNAELIDIENKQNSQTIHKNALKEAIDTAFQNINKKNIQAIIIHISSHILYHEKTAIAEKILQELPIMEYQIIRTNSDTKSTLIELFMFGQNIYESPFMRMFGG